MTDINPQSSTRFRQTVAKGARWMIGLSCLACVVGLPAQTAFNATSMTPDAELEKHFQSPPASARPWVYWMWLDVDTTREAITKDLEEMRAKGIEGVLLYDSGPGTEMKAGAKMVLRGKGYEVVPTKDFPDARITKIPGKALEPWSPRSRELFRYVAKEARRLGLKFCLTVGLSGTSGPIADEDGQQKLMWSAIDVVGPQAFASDVPAPAMVIPPTLGPASRLSPIGSTPDDETAPSTAKFAGHDVAVLAVPDKKNIAAAEVVDLTGRMDSSGRLRWQVPAGKWTIMRFGYAPTGARNAWGLYTDAMSAEALDKTWDATIGQLLKEMSAEERPGIFAVEDDSWEAGLSTWTKLFASEFQKRRGSGSCYATPRAPTTSTANASRPARRLPPSGRSGRRASSTSRTSPTRPSATAAISSFSSTAATRRLSRPSPATPFLPVCNTTATSPGGTKRPRSTPASGAAPTCSSKACSWPRRSTSRATPLAKSSR